MIGHCSFYKGSYRYNDVMGGCLSFYVSVRYYASFKSCCCCSGHDLVLDGFELIYNRYLFVLLANKVCCCPFFVNL